MPRRLLYSCFLFLCSFLSLQLQAADSAVLPGVKQKLIALAEAKVEAVCDGCKITVECKWMAPAVDNISPESIVDLRFSDSGVPAGYVTASIIFDDSASISGTAVQFHITVRQKVPVASADIKRGVAVTGDLVNWQWKDLTRMHRQPVSKSAYFEGKVTSRMIRKGHPFYASDLTGSESIKPGDQVSMLYNKGGVRIHIDCVARDGAAAGEIVRLYSKETGRRYRAKITNDKEIIWEQTL